MSPVTIAILVFVLTAAVFGVTALLMHRQQLRPMQDRLASLHGGPGAGAVSIVTGDGPQGPVARLLLRIGNRSTGANEDGSPGEVEVSDEPKGVGRKKHGIQETLVHAGFRRPSAHAMFVGIRIALALLILVLGLLLSAIFDPALMGASFCFALFGYVIPGFIVARMASQRIQYIRQTLPDTLDLLLLCVEAGLGLNAAMQRVAEERTATGPDPIGEEFLQLSKELQVGLTRREALRNLADRSGSDDVRALASSLIQSEKLGSSIAQTLRAQSDTIRIQRKLEAEELANKVQIKLLFPLIMFIFPTVMIVILFPAGLRLMAALGNLM